MTLCWIVLLAFARSADALQPPTTVDTVPPPWRRQVMPWVTHAGQPRPWRDDKRLTPYFAPGYPDDVQVMFENPDTTAEPRREAMWVTVIAYDRDSDQYLGILINQPRALRSVTEFDNVVFRPDPAGEFPVADAEHGNHATPGWPTSRAPAFFSILRDGVRAYRSGHNGHHMPGIERCIDVLAPAVTSIPPGASVAERFVAHFVLGRCHAEKYETERAIAQFRAAVTLDSSDVDAQMALLAELSVMAHHPPGQRSVAERARWDTALLQQLALVRRRFGTDPDVRQMLDFLFDPSHEATVAEEHRADLPRLRRIGYAVLRWKRR